MNRRMKEMQLSLPFVIAAFEDLHFRKRQLERVLGAAEEAD